LKNRLEHLGIPLNPAFVFSCNSWEPEAGMEFARTLLARPLSITALVAANDALALGFMRVAQQRNIRIPQTLSVVGFDNVPEGALVWPGLTTVSQPMREMGRTACSKLFQNLDTFEKTEIIEYPTELIVRESTGPAAPG
jgi:LacI family transcriptional regulator